MKKYNVAVVGATGMVGSKFLEVLSEKNLPVDNYYLFASAKSAGKVIDFMGKPHTVIELKEENVTDKHIDIALFSAGGGTSAQFAPVFARHGAVVIDNSSQWRMDKDVPLVGARGQSSRHRLAQRHHSQPQLLHHSGNGSAPSPSAQVRSQEDYLLYISGGKRRGRCGIQRLARGT